MGNIIVDMEQSDLIMLLKKFGFTKGSEIFVLHRFMNLDKQQYKTRSDLENELVNILRICSKSTFDKTFAMYNKIKSELLNKTIKSKIELIYKGE